MHVTTERIKQLAVATAEIKADGGADRSFLAPNAEWGKFPARSVGEQRLVDIRGYYCRRRKSQATLRFNERLNKRGPEHSRYF
jgi:hypothetical protein